ncbi:MAG TPA: BadF/BadG/BcrA/BcrD ATPase family protein [Opitutaceae bacterium]
MGTTYKIGVDGGGTKTELILVDDTGAVIARHVAPGCNPSIVGPLAARQVLVDALVTLLEKSRTAADEAPGQPAVARISTTLLCMAGAPAFWQEFATSLTDFGLVTTVDDSRPVLELATGGRPGLVLHGGTGSFVAARGPDGAIHYAGGLGWRFGDPGSGYDLGRRAVARGLLELQGWAPPSRLGTVLRDHTRLNDAAAISRFFYQHTEPNRQIATLAPAVLHLVTEGDPTAHQLVIESASELLDLALRVATKLFPATPLDTIPAGLSGPILTHPSVVATLTPRSPLPLAPLTAPPIEGVRLLLARTP